VNILISGSTGLIGSALCRELKNDHTLHCLQRSDNTCPLYWNISQDTINLPSNCKIDAVIHLAGENIAASRWTTKRKKEIQESRIKGSQLLYNAINKLTSPPQVVISASATGFYGDTNSSQASEETPASTGFLASLCKEWEKQTQIIESKKTRIIHARFGIILSKQGGMLKRILPIFKLGLGGNIGDGLQHMSWVSLTDTVRALEAMLINNDLTGPVNISSPTATTNKELTRQLAKKLHRTAFIHIPKLAVKFILGEMGQELLLQSTNATPQKLIKAGFKFTHPTLEEALADLE